MRTAEHTPPGGEGRPRARLFVAILLPAAVRTAIEVAVAPLRARLSDVRWVRTEHLHLTLRFIGDVERSRVVPIGATLRRDLASLAAPTLSLTGAGVFPSPSRPSVLWAGVRSDERLMALHAATERALCSVGILAEDREFHPHVTVGRVPRGSRPRGVREAIAGVAFETSTPVREVSLMESVLGRGGARHIRVEAVPLADAG